MRVVLGLVSLWFCLSNCSRDGASTCRSIADKLEDLYDRGDNKPALTLADSGLRACLTSSPALYWRFYFRKAELLNRVGDYDRALASLKEDPPSGPAFAHVRCTRRMEQAWAYLSTANYTESRRLLDQAEQEARQSGDRTASLLTRIDIRRIFVYGRQQDFPAARDVMARLRQSSQGVNRFYVFTTYGWFLTQAARFEEAASAFEEAIPEAANKPSELAKIYNNLGSAYYNLRDLDRSLSYTLKAEAILRDHSDPVSLRVCLNNAGLVYLDQGDLPRAKQYLERALKLAQDLKEKESESQVLQNLALTSISTKSWDEAENYNQRALNLEEEQKDEEAKQSTAVSTVRVLAGRGNFDGALQTLSALSHRPVLTVAARIDAEQEYISIYRQLNDATQARAHYRSAVALSESVRASMQKDENKLAWYSSQISLTQEWVRFLIQAHRTSEALEVVEASRARLMTERIGRTSRAGTGTAAAYQRLARNATLISYWLMPEVSYVWIVKPESIEMRTLPGEDAIEASVETYQSFLEGRRDPLRSDNHAGEELRKAVLDPVRPFLNGVKNVILVPDGPLHALNFEALPVDGHYWIDDVTLTVAPSLNLLKAGDPARPKTASAALVIGDATPTSDFPKLPDAGREMETVAHLFPRSTVLRGAQATPAAYLGAPDSAEYIHFAAHASASAERPLDSAVILSGPGNREGGLTAHDLLAKPIHAELVTISACRSAGVRSYHGEGLVGFAWVFLQTGAHGVIAGLWNASDNATADIMSDLYGGIARGEAPPVALREAKLKLVHGQSHFNRPYYWAPFQYYEGAGR